MIGLVLTLSVVLVVVVQFWWLFFKLAVRVVRTFRKFAEARGFATREDQDDRFGHFANQESGRAD